MQCQRQLCPVGRGDEQLAVRVSPPTTPSPGSRGRGCAVWLTGTAVRSVQGSIRGRRLPCAQLNLTGWQCPCHRSPNVREDSFGLGRVCAAHRVSPVLKHLSSSGHGARPTQRPVLPLCKALMVSGRPSSCISLGRAEQARKAASAQPSDRRQDPAEGWPLGPTGHPGERPWGGRGCPRHPPTSGVCVSFSL